MLGLMGILTKKITKKVIKTLVFEPSENGVAVEFEDVFFS